MPQQPTASVDCGVTSRQSTRVLDNSQTIDAYLERMLNDSLDVPVEVINGAITSTWTHHNLIYLNQTILGYDPDMILSLDGYNDFYHFDPDHDQFASYSYNLTSNGIMGDPTIGSLVQMNGWWLYRKSALAHVTIKALRNLRLILRGQPEQRPIDVERSVEVWQDVFPNNALKMLERVGMITQSESIPTFFMLQPMLILERDRAGAPPVEQELFQFNVDSYRPGYEDLIHRVVPMVRELEQEMVERVGAEFIDLTQIFDGFNEQIYTDYAHLTPRGNEILAERVLERILPAIRAELGTGAE